MKPAARTRSFERTAKRLFDVGVTTTGLILLSPVFVLVATAAMCLLGSPILFRQVRPGLHGRPFRMIKFRTMSNDRGPDGKLLPDDRRSTPFGRFLRRTSLDELPELINVLKGDMSLVGPRPLLMDYLPHYTPEQMRRHDMRPGITGWAQVNGRNAIDWDAKFDLDLWYIDHWSLWLDVKILMLTIWKVLRREGISAAGHETAPRFDAMKMSKK